MKQLSEKMFAMLERLAEMFPQQTYQSRLEQYLTQYTVDNTAQLESLQRRFDQQQARGFL
jgi:hypothetical protein